MLLKKEKKRKYKSDIIHGSVIILAIEGQVKRIEFKDIVMYVVCYVIYCTFGEM